MPMDVRCDHCKTEYELDNARITEAGVSVKCAQCGHVFRVRKKTMLVTESLAPGDPELASTLTEGERGREWQLRQKDKIVLIRELSTLQRWIVERKALADDELSLTGDVWKKLESIPELAPFFAVVELARGRELEGAGLASSLDMALPGSRPDMPRRTVSAELNLMMPSESARLGSQTPLTLARRATGEFPITPQTASTPVQIASQKSGSAKWVLGGILMAFVTGAYIYGGVLQRPMPSLASRVSDAWAKLKGEPSPASAEPGASTPSVGHPMAAQPTPSLAPPAGSPALLAKPPPSPADLHPSIPAPVAFPSEPPAPPEPAPVAKTPEPAVPTAAQPLPEAPVSVAAKQQPPKTFEAHLMMGHRLRARERLEPALAAYDKALQLRPGNADALTGKGLVLLDLENLRDAEDSFLGALKANPTSLDALMGLAETYRAQGRKADAVRYYEQYLSLAPDGPEAPVARSAIQKLRN
ncbi:MAG: tetratricopeptide repeat protein [Myxococcaceae bacterium]